MVNAKVADVTVSLKKEDRDLMKRFCDSVDRLAAMEGGTEDVDWRQVDSIHDYLKHKIETDVKSCMICKHKNTTEHCDRDGLPVDVDCVCANFEVKK